MQFMRNLSIKAQTVIAISVFSACVIGGIYFYSFDKISNNFTEFEDRHALEYSEKVYFGFLTYVQSAIRGLSELEQLDDFYQFSKDQFGKFQYANKEGAISSLGIDNFSFWSKEKKLLWGGHLRAEHFSALSQNDIVTIKNIQGLHAQRDNVERHTYARLDDGNYLLVSLPITSKIGKANIQGHLIGGIRIDDKFFSMLERQVQLKIEPIDKLPSFAGKLISENVGVTNFIAKNSNEKLMHIYGSMKDFNSQPLINYRITLKRHSQHLYQSTMNTFLIAMIFGGIAMVLVVVISVNRLLISRISTLSDLISIIKKTGDIKQRVPELGGDEIGQLGKSFNEMFEEINQLREASFHNEKLASLGEMAGGIAHEINNPITIIAASAHILKKMILKGSLDNEKIIKQIDDIEKTVFRISKIINGLRNVSRDATSEEFAECRLLDILTDTLSISSEKFKAHGIEIKVNLDDPIFNTKLLCLRVQLSQVFFNLFGNSYDAIEGQEGAWIEITASMSEPANDEEQMIIIRCTDSGHGIPKEIQSKIFQPFYTTKEIGKGTGLGLSLSNSIILRHGGTFTIDNESKNTCFVIKLPVRGAKIEK